MTRLILRAHPKGSLHADNHESVYRFSIDCISSRRRFGDAGSEEGTPCFASNEDWDLLHALLRQHPYDDLLLNPGADGSVSRLASEKEAADYIGLEVATFRAWVSSGRLPQAIADCGKYDLKAIDLAIDRISGIGSATNALDTWRANKQCA